MTADTANAYRTALALNNLAVKLMQIGHFIPALEALRESLFLMQTVFDPETRSPDSYSADTFQVVSARYLGSLQYGPTVLSEIVVGPLGDEDLISLRAAVKYGPSASLFSPVLISESSCVENEEAAEISRQVGIIFYNEGLANFLLSNHHRESKTGRYLLASYKSLQMAEITFTTLSDELGDNPAAFSCILLSAMVLNSLSLVYHRLDLNYRAEEAERVVAIYCSEVDSDWFTSVAALGGTAAAA
jgi:hypothetical protein